jgi:hypothetical protein
MNLYPLAVLLLKMDNASPAAVAVAVVINVQHRFGCSGVEDRAGEFDEAARIGETLVEAIPPAAANGAASAATVT